jgi:hypothetical protein
MSSSENIDQLYKIVGMRRMPEDDIVPDSVAHLVYLRKNTDAEESPESPALVPIFCSGSQWDLMWWIYRLQDCDTTFDDFLASFLGEIYETYRRK